MTVFCFAIFQAQGMHAAFFKQAAKETEKRQQLALGHSASWCRRHLEAHACLLIARPGCVRTNRKGKIVSMISSNSGVPKMWCA